MNAWLTACRIILAVSATVLLIVAAMAAGFMAHIVEDRRGFGWKQYCRKGWVACQCREVAWAIGAGVAMVLLCVLL